MLLHPARKSFMSGTIRLIGDSFGTPRLHWEQVEVPDDATWPRQVQRALPEGEVQFDFKPFRRIVECPDLLANHFDCQMSIVQAGIVDCFPRPLRQDVTRSNSFVCRVLRRCIRPIRREWTNYIYRTTWSTREEIVAALDALLTQHPSRITGIVTAAPLRHEHAVHSPGAQEAIFEFNDLIRETVQLYPRGFVIDMHTAVLALGHRRLLSSWDSHFNQEGNDWFANEVLREISQRLRQSAPSTASAIQRSAA
jgi:hypothetical protein